MCKTNTVTKINIKGKKEREKERKKEEEEGTIKYRIICKEHTMCHREKKRKRRETWEKERQLCMSDARELSL